MGKHRAPSLYYYSLAAYERDAHGRRAKTPWTGNSCSCPFCLYAGRHR